MLSSTISAIAFMALGAFALPAPEPAQQTTGNYTLNIKNNCNAVKHLATFQIKQPEFSMNQLSNVLTLEPKKNGTISVPFNALGVRLSAKADQPLGDQWKPQALVEFGYSAFMGLVGTAYDLSMMDGTDQTNSISVCPANKACGCKSHKAGLLADVKQLWTAASQSLQGSPADTTCMKGKVDFDIVYCP